MHDAHRSESTVEQTAADGHSGRKPTDINALRVSWRAYYNTTQLANLLAVTPGTISNWRRQWGPGSPAPFPAPDTELLATNGRLAPAWSRERPTSEFTEWNLHRQSVPVAPPRPGSNRPGVVTQPNGHRAAESPPVPSANTDSAGERSTFPPIREFIKPARRRSGGGARHGSTPSPRVARGMRRGGFR